MIKFIIVENEVQMQSKIRNIILKTAFDVVEFEIEKFKSLDDNLLKTIEDLSVPKIYLLDIELDNNISGIQIAKKIRSIDWESHIIFLTNHDKMFESIYRSIYEVFDFIEKFDDMEKRLEKDLKLLLSRKYDNKLFIYKTKRVELQIYLKDIVYVYRDTYERKVCIRTTHNSFKLSLNLNQIFEKLDSRFRQVHRACIVNTERVVKYDWTKGEFLLDNNEVVPMLSRSYRNKVEENAK